MSNLTEIPLRKSMTKTLGPTTNKCHETNGLELQRLRTLRTTKFILTSGMKMLFSEDVSRARTSQTNGYTKWYTRGYASTERACKNPDELF